MCVVYFMYVCGVFHVCVWCISCMCMVYFSPSSWQRHERSTVGLLVGLQSNSEQTHSPVRIHVHVIYMYIVQDITDHRRTKRTNANHNIL